MLPSCSPTAPAQCAPPEATRLTAQERSPRSRPRPSAPTGRAGHRLSRQHQRRCGIGQQPLGAVQRESRLVWRPANSLHNLRTSSRRLRGRHSARSLGHSGARASLVIPSASLGHPEHPLSFVTLSVCEFLASCRMPLHTAPDMSLVGRALRCGRHHPGYASPS